MKWLAIAAIACAVLGIGVAKRDWLIRRFQHAPGTRLVLGFERDVPEGALERARDIVAERLPQASVRVDGHQIVVELDPDPLTASLARDLKTLLAHPPRVELRVVDVDSTYMKALARAPGGESLGVSAKNEGWKTGDTVYLDRYLTAADESRHVNEAWAAHHGCKAKRDSTYGIYCPLTGRELITAFVAGDSDLEIPGQPPERALPADRELVFGRIEARAWRSYLVEHDALVLDGAALAGVRNPDAKDLVVDLTPAGGEQVAQLAAHSPSGRVVVIVGGEVRGAADASAIRASDRFAIPVTTDRDATWEALRLAALPAPLRLLDESSY